MNRNPTHFRCINVGTFEYELTLGKIYPIIEVRRFEEVGQFEDCKILYRIRDDQGRLASWSNSRNTFEFVNVDERLHRITYL